MLAVLQKVRSLVNEQETDLVVLLETIMQKTRLNEVFYLRPLKDNPDQTLYSIIQKNTLTYQNPSQEVEYKLSSHA
jgi:hypothetical protein